MITATGCTVQTPQSLEAMPRRSERRRHESACGGEVRHQVDRLDRTAIRYAARPARRRRQGEGLTTELIEHAAGASSPTCSRRTPTPREGAAEPRRAGCRASAPLMAVRWAARQFSAIVLTKLLTLLADRDSARAACPSCFRRVPQIGSSIIRTSSAREVTTAVAASPRGDGRRRCDVEPGAADGPDGHAGDDASMRRSSAAWKSRASAARYDGSVARQRRMRDETGSRLDGERL